MNNLYKNEKQFEDVTKSWFLKQDRIEKVRNKREFKVDVSVINFETVLVNWTITSGSDFCIKPIRSGNNGH